MVNGNEVEQSGHAGRGRGRFGGRRDGLRPSPVGREVPFSAEAEEHVIACALLDGSDTIDRAKREGVTSESFFDPKNRQLWALITELHEAKPPVTLEVLAEELKTRRLLEAVGGFAHLMQVTGKIPTTAHAGYFIEKIIEKECLRKAVMAATEIVEGAYSYTGGGLSGYAKFAEPLQRLSELKDKTRRELPPIMRWADFVPAEQSKLPDELVDGILHRGAKMMVAGGSKSFKTWVLLHLGLSVASGTPWWGMRTRAGRVLYVNLELMREFCEVRVRQIKAAMKLDAVPGFDSWHLRGYARDFKELLPHFLAAVAGAKYDLIILDPVYKILGERDENANGEVAQLLNEFEALAVRTGAAVAYGHHHSKGNQSEKDARDRSSGAGAWTRDPDALIDLTPHEEDEHFTATFTLRNCPPKSAMVLRWEFPVMSFAPGMDPTALRKPGRPKEKAVADVLVILTGRRLAYGQWLEEAERRGVSETTFKRLLKKAREEGKVVEEMGFYRLKGGN